MVGPNQYVPILRSKDGEMYALRQLRPDDRQRITPLIEITPRIFQPARTGRYKGLEPVAGEVLFQQAKKLFSSWHYGPFFMDLWHVDGKVILPGNKSPLEVIAKHLRDWRLNMVPVTGLGRSAPYQDSIARVASADRRGVCIRIVPSEVLANKFTRTITTLRRHLQLTEADLDLLVDYGTLEEESPDLGDVFAKIPRLDAWRSIIVASGAFPKDLQAFKPGIHKIPRSDWHKWKQQIASTRLARKPTFSDYTIQYGKYVEPVDHCNPSASIRYTLDDDWLIMRGEAIIAKKGKDKENGPGSTQWIAHAMLLRDGGEFCGSDFSDGDAYIFAMSQKTGKPCGTPMTWIRAGLNHHLTLVSRQIAGLHGV
jgi:hypothetical protein